MTTNNQRVVLNELLESLSDDGVAAILPAVRTRIEQHEYVEATLEETSDTDAQLEWEMEYMPAADEHRVFAGVPVPC